MNLLEQIRGNFPKTIDKSKPVFSSLIGNEKGNGAIQRQLTYLLNYMKEWISTPNVYKQTGVMLEKTITFFSFLERFAGETEQSLKNRFRAIFVRNHDTRWGTVFDVKSVFKQYFPHATIYVVENTNKIDDVTPGLGNLLPDGEISSENPDGWNVTDCDVSEIARFSKKYGILLNHTGAKLVSQSISINSSSAYFLHFFLKGKVHVQIKNNNNKYWDFSTKDWSSDPVDNNFESTESWNNQYIYFLSDATTTSVTITFSYVDTETFIDYFRLFEKQPYGSFTVIAYFEGNTSVGVFGLAAGEDDPNITTEEELPPQPRYGNYGYYDKSYLSGVPIGFATDIYEDLLDYLRAQGVRAFLEIVVGDIIPEE
jgi:hypothetical protein